MGALLGVRQQVGDVFCGLMSTFQVLLLGLSSCAVTPRYVFSLFFFLNFHLSETRGLEVRIRI